MKIKLDENLGRRGAEIFRTAGWAERERCPSERTAAACRWASLSLCPSYGATGLYQSHLQELSGKAAHRFRDSQRRWLAARDECGSDVSCIADRYRERIDWLRRTTVNH